MIPYKTTRELINDDLFEIKKYWSKLIPKRKKSLSEIIRERDKAYVELIKVNLELIKLQHETTNRLYK